jgi:hypothetical protein
LSNIFEAAIFAAASARSALASTIDTTLPMPTPIAGVPLEYAARIFDCDPVAATRSQRRISSCVDSFVTGAGSTCTRSAGAPTPASAACTNSSSFCTVL